MKKIPISDGRVYLKATKANVLKYTNSKNLLNEKHYLNYDRLKYIRKLSSELSIPFKTEYEAIQMAEKVSNSPAFIGNRSKNLAPAIIYAE